MKKNKIEKLSDKIVNAFLKNKLIDPLPKKYTKKLTQTIEENIICNL